MEDVFSGARPFSLNSHVDEEALKWFAIGRLPTYDRLRSSIINSFMDNELHADKTMHKKVDVRKLDLDDRQEFINRIFKVAEDDNEKYLKKFRAFLLMILNAKRCFFFSIFDPKACSIKGCKCHNFLHWWTVQTQIWDRTIHQL